MWAMDQLQTLNRYTILASVIVVVLVNVTARAIQRLYFSPLARFPGPKLAALTSWYEFYFEVIQKGRMSFRIQDLHKEYGPVVRITPEEIHVNDHTFWDTLYVKHPKASKYDWLNGRFGNRHSIFTTNDWAHHRMRRAPLNPMFSQRAITEQEPFVQDRMSFLCERLVKFQSTGEVVALQKMWSAFTCDAITKYMFGFNYDQLASVNFESTFHQVFIESGVFANITLHFPWIGSLMNSLPESWVLALNPAVEGLIKLTNDIKRITTQAILEHDRDIKPEKRTIFHEILDSDLPPEEKIPLRLSDEIMTIIGAGLVTTAWALTVTCFYLHANPAILETLRAELNEAVPDLSQTDAFAYQKLSKLPFLHGCVKEGIRLSTGVSCRLPRIVDSAVECGHWTIPPGTPVSMTIQDMHFNEKAFPEPNKFIPKRWFNNPKAPDGESLEKYFVAFGKGARSCIGINMAYLEVTVGLAIFVRKFRCELFETDVSDVELMHDFLIPSPRLDSKGVRVKVVGVEA